MTEASQTIPFVDRRCTHRNCADKTGVYRMVGRCLNCGTTPILGLFTSGHEHSHGGDCPVCGVSRLHWDRLASPEEIPAAVAS
jgi:hypothetical protein